MTRIIIHIAMGAVTFFAVGTATGSVLSAATGEATSILTPFMVISVAVLVAAAGYAAAALGGLRASRRDNRTRRGDQ